MSIFSNLESEIIRFLSDHESFIVSEAFQRSTRGVGDAIEDLIVKNLDDIASNISDVTHTDFSRRAMEDVALESDGNYYAIDIKTHRLSTKFNMPNLTSVKRLMDFYEERSNYFTVAMIEYNLSDGGELADLYATVEPIEHFSWECLRIGALGWGQIQFRNASDIVVNTSQTRKEWLKLFTLRLREHYAGEKEKIEERLEYIEGFIQRAL